MVIFQIMLTIGSIAYEINKGFAKFHPTTTKGIVTVILEYGFLGLLYSPLAFLHVLGTSLLRTGILPYIHDLPDKIATLPNELALPLTLLYVPASILFVLAFFYVSFLPFRTFIGNLDYAVTLLPCFNTAKRKSKNIVSEPINNNWNNDWNYVPREPSASETGLCFKEQSGQPILPEGSGFSNGFFKTRNLNAFKKLIGVDKAIEEIMDALELPLLYPEKVKDYGIKPPKGLLLCGPPGTGKTSLARAAAEYFGCYFVYVKGSELLKPYVGSSEESVKTLFGKARANKPAIIFFDEIDAICRKRDGSNLNRASDIILNILLAEMDGFEQDHDLFIIGATNRVDVLDEAVLRPGRFDSIIELSLPDEDARAKLFWLFLNGKPVAERLELMPFAQQTEGMSPAQIESICRKAALRALKREVSANCEKPGLKMEDVFAAIEEELQFSLIRKL